MQKFCYPASEYVLGGILPEDEYHVWILIVRIAEMIFQIGQSGWSDDDIQLLKQLILRHNILTEEVEGLKSCVVTLHNLIHYPANAFQAQTITGVILLKERYMVMWLGHPITETWSCHSQIQNA